MPICKELPMAPSLLLSPVRTWRQRASSGSNLAPD